jgi:integrase
MTKIFRLPDDVYAELKARAVKTGKMWSGAGYALLHMAATSCQSKRSLIRFFFMKKSEKTSGPGRIRTGNLRHVKAPFRNCSPCCSSLHPDCQLVKETIIRDEEVPEGGLLSLELQFGRDELASYTEYRKTELTRKSADWINRASNAFWLSTSGAISAKTISDLRVKTLAKYTCESSKSKVLTFAVAFLKYLAKIRLDLRYRSFELFLERPRRIKVRKNVTSRIVIKEDIERVLDHIHSAERSGNISRSRAEQYTAFTVFGAFTGQRSMATMMKLTVGQLSASLKVSKPVLRVESHQDKIRMEHYVPLHPQVVEAIRPLLDGRQDNELMFRHGSFWMWVKRQEIPMSQFDGHFVLGDLRKFAEQHGDTIHWNQSNRAYIMTHGVSGIDWKHYKHPLPENVYSTYMLYWGDVEFSE